MPISLTQKVSLFQFPAMRGTINMGLNADQFQFPAGRCAPNTPGPTGCGLRAKLAAWEQFGMTVNNSDAFWICLLSVSLTLKVSLLQCSVGTVVGGTFFVAVAPHGSNIPLFCDAGLTPSYPTKHCSCANPGGVCSELVPVECQPNVCIWPPIDHGIWAGTHAHHLQVTQFSCETNYTAAATSVA